MNHFAATVLRPYIIESGYLSICEIGASGGQTTNQLLQTPTLFLDIVDPCLDADLVKKYEHQKNVRVHRGISLDILPLLEKQFDCILIDGDHNWYTVYNELRIIFEKNLLKPTGTIFFHDVGFPYGRRDMYYRPELIPSEFVHPNARQGVTEGQSELTSEGGQNSTFYNAVHEGGARNGVLTAIEDFIKKSGRNLLFYRLIEEHGLGVMYQGASGNAAFKRYARHAKYLKLKNYLRRFIHHLPGAYALLAKLRTRA